MADKSTKNANLNISHISRESIRKIKTEYETLLRETKGIEQKQGIYVAKKKTESLAKGSQELYDIILEATNGFNKEMAETLKNAEILKQQVTAPLNLKVTAVDYKNDSDGQDWLSFIDHPEFFILLN